MSGGHFDYVYHKVRAGLEDVTQDEEVKRRWPHVTAALNRLSESLSETLREIEWDLSGDSHIEHDSVFEQEFFRKMYTALWPNPSAGSGPGM